MRISAPCSIRADEALSLVVQEGRVDRATIAYAGLKDRQAVTDQYVSIQGRAVELSMPGLRLSPIGRSSVPINSRMSRGNAFAIVVRDLKPTEEAMLRRGLPSLLKTGFPNYFDDQRFGSVTSDGDFIARPWIEGDYEKTLWLGLAAESPHDRSAEKREKATLRDHWGDWPTVMKRLGRSHRRSIISYLVQHPQDFKGAWARVRQDMRSLYLSAFQSHLWNKILATAIRSTCPEDKRVEVRLALGPAPFFRELPSQATIDLATLMIPLPSSRSLTKRPRTPPDPRSCRNSH